MNEKRIIRFGSALVTLLYASVFLTYPDKFFAEDSYFYFQVAWNFARGMGSTFNNLMPTNGYHPLWMLLCAGVFKILPGKTAAMHGIAFLILVLDSLMLAVVAFLLERVKACEWWVSFLILIPFSFLSQLGTEGALSALALSLFALTAYRFTSVPDTRSALLFHLCGALTILSRLDNIFIVALVWITAFFVSECTKGTCIRLQMFSVPIYLMLVGGYLASNQIFFHTWQPISGMLKSTGNDHHRLFGNLPPHTAGSAIAVIIPCFLYLAYFKRDLFFKIVEVPFTVGILLHGAYIVFRMSSETRWSWYFTSWMLLAGIMMARTVSDLFDRFHLGKTVRFAFSAFALTALTAFWIKGSLLHYRNLADTGRPTVFQEEIGDKRGIKRAIAFDYPGRIGYYSDIQIVPLDGLMGNLEFQYELANKGIERYIADHQIDGFIGPSLPMDKGTSEDLCNNIHNGAVKFNCLQVSPSEWRILSVDIYSRIPHQQAGTLALPSSRIVWSSPHLVTVWRLRP